MRTLTKRQVASAAWREYKVSLAAQGAAGEEMLAMSRPPSGFVAVELGFGFGEGPSLLATMQDIDRAQERRRVLLGDRSMVLAADLPDVVGADTVIREAVAAPSAPSQREHASARSKRLDAMLRHLMRKQQPAAAEAGDALSRAIQRANASRRAA